MTPSGPAFNQIQRFPFTEILGWSVSRYDVFTRCRRQYFYDYYAKFDTEFPLAKLRSLKQLTSIPLETGNIVHDTLKKLLERLLVSDKPVDRARFLEFTRKMTDEYCRAKTFYEVHYGQVPSVDPAALYQNAAAILTGFLDSARFRWIVEKALTNKQGWVIEPPGFGETRIDGFKAYCKVDFLFPVDGILHILDWKTGKADEKKHRRQLIGYAAWAQFHFKHNPAAIEPVIVYLAPPAHELKVAIAEEDLRSFVDSVKAESAEMHALCSSLEKNIPLPKDRFPRTANASVCRFCNYRELCV